MSRFSRYIIKLILLIDLMLVVGILAEQKLAGVDSYIYTLAGRICGRATTDRALLHTPGTPIPLEQVVLRKHTPRYPHVLYLEWDEGETEPTPKIQELATILHCLATKTKTHAVGVSTPLMWVDSGDAMAHHMVDKALQELRHTVIGFSGRTAAQAGPTPEQLTGAAIPRSNIRGNTGSLPSANTPLPYHLPMADGAPLWAPDYIEDEPLTHDESLSHGLSQPLLTRWNGEVMPTLALRLALAELGLTPADVQVNIGKSIRIGERMLPLDAHGRTPLGAARAQQKSLHQILTAPANDNKEEINYAIVARAFSPTLSGQRGKSLAATLSRLLSKEEESFLTSTRPQGNYVLEMNAMQATGAGRVILAALIVCLLIWLPLLSERILKPLLIALPCGIILLAIIWGIQGIGMSLCAWILCGVLLYPICRWLSRLSKS